MNFSNLHVGREKYLETCLVISTGMILLWLVYQSNVLLIIGFVIGIIGLFIQPLAKMINWIWYKLSEILGMIVPKVLLSAVFFLFLFPIALLARLFNKDALQLRKRNDDNASYWIERNHEYTDQDLENIW